MPVALPGAWREVSGQVRLRVRGSRLLKPGSELVLTANGQPIGATSVRPGDSWLQATIPPLPARGRLTLGLEGVLRTGPRSCDRPPGPGSFVTLLSPSDVTLNGRRDASAPILSQFPGSFVERAGDQSRPLLVALPGDPTPEDVQAASLLAGAVARAARTPSLRVLLASGERAAALAPQAAGNLIVLRRGGGPAVASVTRRAGDFRQLVLTGRGDRLVDGAWQLATDAGSLHRARTVLHGEVDRDVVRRPSRRQVRVTRAVTRTPGTSTLAARAVLPPEIELGHDAEAELKMAYDAPEGGRVTAQINGNTTKSKDLDSEDGRVKLRFGLGDQPTQSSAGDLRIGSNALGVQVTLDQEEGCRREDRSPELALLRSSHIDFDGERRERRKPNLGLFPFPLSETPTWEDAQVVLGREPNDRELAEAVMVLAEQQRVSQRPILPDVVFGPRRTRDDRDLLVLAPSRRLPRALDLDLPARPRTGSVMVARRGDDRVAYVAFGARAWRGLRENYTYGSMSGRAVSVGPDGRIRSRPTDLSAHRPPPSPWIFPVVALVLIAGTWVALRVRRVRRRLRDQPVPAPIEPGGEAR
jgi:hypothetical protein